MRFGTFTAGLLVAALAVVPAGAQTKKPEKGSYSFAENYEVGPEVYVRALAVDQRRNSLWVGTSLGALEIDLASYNLKNTFTRDNSGLANEYVFAVGVEPKGTVWFGTNAGGASSYQNGQWKTYFPMHGLADYWIYSFAFDKAGKTWLGTWDGVSHFDPATGKFASYRSELVNVWVYGIDIDKKDRVWFGTEGGVTMLDGKTWKSWTHDDGLGAPNTENLARSSNTGLGTRARHDLAVTQANNPTYNPNYVFGVMVDKRDQKIWFGTWGAGVSSFDGVKTWKSYTKADGLAGNVVYAIAQEDSGALWFGTDKGVSRWDGATWTTFGKKDGLINEHVYSIVIDPKGMVWLATKGGVSRLAKN